MGIDGETGKTRWQLTHRDTHKKLDHYDTFLKMLPQFTERNNISDKRERNKERRRETRMSGTRYLGLEELPKMSTRFYLQR